MAYNLITVSGPRGAGKDTVLSEILRRYGSQLYRIIPCTTRSPREGEIHGLQQYFMSETEFAEQERMGNFIFTNPMNESGYRSGTLKSELNKKLSIVDITATGAFALREHVQTNGGQALSFFIFADAITRLRRIIIRQPDVPIQTIIQMMQFDPTEPNPFLHEDWFVKIENPDDCLQQTFECVNGHITEFMEAIAGQYAT